MTFTIRIHTGNNRIQKIEPNGNITVIGLINLSEKIDLNINDFGPGKFFITSPIYHQKINLKYYLFFYSTLDSYFCTDFGITLICL